MVGFFGRDGIANGRIFGRWDFRKVWISNGRIFRKECTSNGRIFGRYALQIVESSEGGIFGRD
jgi:hypothetical protein